MARQLGLFGDEVEPEPGASRRPPAPPPVEHSPALRELGRALPAEVRLGTSSWSFAGWDGLVYQGIHSQTTLSRYGLSAYAQHPLLRAAGVDRSYYGPLDAETWRAYAQQVPEGFRFLAKAYEGVTLARYPDHPRYGANRRQQNPYFLDPELAREAVVEPFVSGLGARGGAILFQLPPQSPAVVGGPQAFAQRLKGFLARLPRGPLYAVELRTKQLLTRDYQRALADTGAVHCVSAHPSMPPPRAQARYLAPDRPLVARWMLRRDLAYGEAREAFAPFDRLVEPDPEVREQLAELCVGALARGQSALVSINNKAEGCAPLSAIGLAEAIVERL